MVITGNPLSPPAHKVLIKLANLPIKLVAYSNVAQTIFITHLTKRNGEVLIAARLLLFIRARNHYSPTKKGWCLFMKDNTQRTRILDTL